MPSNIASLAITARARLIAALANPLIQVEADDANVTVAFGTPKVVAVRNPIGEFLTVQMTTGATPAPIPFDYTSASTYAELLILILAHYGVAFEADDIVGGSFTGIPTLTAAPDSIGWTGSFTFPEFGYIPT